jgi:hypothetical protein
MSLESQQDADGTILVTDLAESVKSSNAGASALTFEVGFATGEAYDLACRSGNLNAGEIGRRYQVDPADVEIYHYGPAWTIKLTIPRDTFARQLDETDFDGVQQHVLLLDIAITPPSAPDPIASPTKRSSEEAAA